MTGIPEQTEWIAWYRETKNEVARNFSKHVCGESRESAIGVACSKESETIKLNGVSLIPADDWYKLNQSDYKKSF